MPANGLLYARRSGQGDLEPDGEAVAGIRRILRGPPISVRHAGRDPPPKDTFTFGLRSALATDNNKAVAGACILGVVGGDAPGLIAGEQASCPHAIQRRYLAGQCQVSARAVSTPKWSELPHSSGCFSAQLTNFCTSAPCWLAANTMRIIGMITPQL